MLSGQMMINDFSKTNFGCKKLWTALKNQEESAV
jgi:hypothetical protein